MLILGTRTVQNSSRNLVAFASSCLFVGYSATSTCIIENNPKAQSRDSTRDIASVNATYIERAKKGAARWTRDVDATEMLTSTLPRDEIESFRARMYDIRQKGPGQVSIEPCRVLIASQSLIFSLLIFPVCETYALCTEQQHVLVLSIARYYYPEMGAATRAKNHATSPPSPRFILHLSRVCAIIIIKIIRIPHGLRTGH
jgi:hypothetical protein